MKIWLRLLLVIALSMLLFHPDGLAQDSIRVAYSSLGLYAEENNVIHNAHQLEKFFQKLQRLKEGSDSVVNIVHIGDSHIQADFMTKVVRRRFQKDFGNAGRGLIVPGRVAGTNEPFNVRSSSNASWQPKRIIFVNDSLPIGIGGITIKSADSLCAVTILMNDLWMDYRFTKADVFFHNTLKSFGFVVKDTANDQQTTFRAETIRGETGTAVFKTPVGGMILQAKATHEMQNHFTLFGINLRNDSIGVRYHAIGVNGAKYSHYNAARLFAEQSKKLQPDLFIISLGTNESLDYPYLDKNFANHVSQFVSRLQANNPDACVMLVTPPDAFRKRNKINPGLTTIRNQILEYAVEHGFAFWDMYKALAPAHVWRSHEILRPDGIHFTKEGYEFQGHIFFEALMKAYHNYVGHQPR